MTLSIKHREHLADWLARLNYAYIKPERIAGLHMALVLPVKDHPGTYRFVYGGQSFGIPVVMVDGAPKVKVHDLAASLANEIIGRQSELPDPTDRFLHNLNLIALATPERTPTDTAIAEAQERKARA